LESILDFLVLTALYFVQYIVCAKFLLLSKPPSAIVPDFKKSPQKLQIATMSDKSSPKTPKTPPGVVLEDVGIAVSISFVKIMQYTVFASFEAPETRTHPHPN
jgi:hypothetical protein